MRRKQSSAHTMSHIIRGLALALIMFGPCGAVAVSRPAMAAEKGQGYEPTTEEIERQKLLRQLKEWGVADETIQAVGTEFRPKPPDPSRRPAGQLEPEKPDHHEQPQPLHDECDSLQSPDDIEKCKRARHSAAARELMNNSGMQRLPKSPQKPFPADEQEIRKALEQLQERGVSEQTLGAVERALGIQR